MYPISLSLGVSFLRGSCCLSRARRCSGSKRAVRPRARYASGGGAPVRHYGAAGRRADVIEAGTIVRQTPIIAEWCGAWSRRLRRKGRFDEEGAIRAEQRRIGEFRRGGFGLQDLGLWLPAFRLPRGIDGRARLVQCEAARG